MIVRELRQWKNGCNELALRRVTRNSDGDDRKVRPTFTGVERSSMLKQMEGAVGTGDMPEADVEILLEAYERFAYCSEWEENFRDQYVQDVKFANADPDNGWQWPDDLRRDRMLNRRPALTINKVQNHVNLVVNDGKQNKAAIKISPTGKESSFKAAKGIEGVIRNIEYQSNAQTIYDDCLQSSVEGGIGYGRVVTMYPDPRSFSQELRIVPVQDHLGVYIDPDIKQKNGSDAKFGFVFEDLTRDEYERQMDEEAPIGSAPFSLGLSTDWVRANHIRVAEYYRINYKQDELIYYRHGNEESIFLRSEVPRSMKQRLRMHESMHKKGMLPGDVEIKTRPTEIKTLQWYKIAAHGIKDREEYQTQYVPIFRFVGRERIINQKLERKGLVRGMKDAQRMYNYNSSAEAEAAALATKTNWLVALESIAGNTQIWDRANVDNKPYLPWRHKDRDGDPIPPPQRIDPARQAEAYLAGMEIAARELEMASGQGPAQFGKPTQERSGKAIGETQRQGEILTFDFIDNASLGVQYVGMILLDWIPHCYKTKQVIQILDEDGTERLITIDPQAKSPYEEQKLKDEIQAILNPNIGKYKVQAQAGPAYATQRQEAWNAFVQIVTGAPDLINEIGDLMFLAADFPMADLIAERMRRKIKQLSPWLLDDNAQNPMVQQLQQQIQQASQQIAELLQQLGEKDRKLKDQTRDINIKRADVVDKFRKTDIAGYSAHTQRLAAIANTESDLAAAGQTGEFTKLIQQIVKETLKEPELDEHVSASADLSRQSAAEADFSTPRLAPDGNHYIRKGGQHYKVDTKALLATPKQSAGGLNGAGNGQPA
jgi:hypothetical protein